MENCDADTLLTLNLIVKQFNKYFHLYNASNEDNHKERIIHFKSKHLNKFPRLLNLYHGNDFTSTSLHTKPECFDEFYNNIQLLKSLKISFVGDTPIDLHMFCSLDNLILTGPSHFAVKGLRTLSSRLKSLIVERANANLNVLLSQCCMDESGPMSWPCLVSLAITQCTLTHLDSSFKLLPCLQELDLSFNALTLIGEEICYLDQLTHLNLSFNRLREIPQIRGSVRWRLQYLCLAYNEISSLEGINSLECLHELDLSSNLIVSHDLLQPLRHLHHLEQLKLEGNPLCFHKRHRLLSLLSISPTAIKPEFLLDGKLLSRRELKDIMYTPMAIPIPATGLISNQASINNLEVERYDVSMSSAASAIRRKTISDIRSSSIPNSQQRRRSAKPTFQIANTFHSSLMREDKILKDEDDSILSLNQHASLEFEPSDLQSEPTYHSSSSAATPMDFENDSDELSIVSAISQDSDSHIQLSETAESPVSCHDEDFEITVQTEATSEDYMSPIEEFNVYKTNIENKSSQQRTGSVTSDENDRLGSTTTSESKTSEADTLIGDEEDDMEEDVTPPLHVKRKLAGNNSEDVLRGPAEVYLAATHNHLVERDIERGKVWESLELSTVCEVSLQSIHEIPILEIKFTYLRKDRRTRHYTVLDVGANEAVNLLFRELESIALGNRSRNFVCLKCSRHFIAEPQVDQNSALDSYSLQSYPISPGAIYGLGQYSNNGTKSYGVTCSCGSDMVVESESQTVKNPQLFTVNEDECHEATESRIDSNHTQEFKSERSQNIPVTKGHVNDSLSWMHSLQSIPDVSGSFAPAHHAQYSNNDGHLSGSLPANLSSVLMRPGVSERNNLDASESVPSVAPANHQATPFKTFSHLLTPHDIYKLVDVTPSDMLGSKGVTQHENSARDNSGAFTPQGPTSGLQQNDKFPVIRPISSGGRKLVVTSTPRRRPAALQVRASSLSMDGNNKIANFGASNTDRESKRRRALNFENSESSDSDSPVGSVEYYQWDEPEISEDVGNKGSRFGINSKLKLFIEKELLEAEEEICAAVETKLSCESGKVLGTWVSETTNPRKNVTPGRIRRGLFGSSKKVEENTSSKGMAPSDSVFSSEEAQQNETDVLLLLTTDNVQLLRVTNPKKTLTPETLDCMDTHCLDHVVGLELGLSNSTLYFAIAKNFMENSEVNNDISKLQLSGTRGSGKKKKIAVDCIDQVYAVHFRSSEKCERFYRRWIDIYRSRRDDNSRAPSTVSSTSSVPIRSPAMNNTKNPLRSRHNSLLGITDDARCYSAYSDALEKNFSEHVLMNLDMNVPDIPSDRVNSRSLLIERLFACVSCWILDETVGREVPVSLVISCGGTVTIVVEQRFVIMYGFASAIVRVRNSIPGKSRSNSSALLENSFSSSTSSRGNSPALFSIRLPQTSIPPLMTAAYVIKSVNKCSSLKRIVRYKDHPLCLEFHFKSSKGHTDSLTWQLTLAFPFSLTDLLELVTAYYEVENNSELEVVWM